MAPLAGDTHYRTFGAVLRLELEELVAMSLMQTALGHRVAVGMRKRSQPQRVMVQLLHYRAQ